MKSFKEMIMSHIGFNKEIYNAVKEGGGGGGGTTNYNELENKPSINNTSLTGNKTGEDLGLQAKLTPGSNIKIEDNEISSEISIYRHIFYIKIAGAAYFIAYTDVFNTSPSMTLDEFKLFLATSGATSPGTPYPLTGYYQTKPLVGIFVNPARVPIAICADTSTTYNLPDSSFALRNSIKIT